MDMTTFWSTVPRADRRTAGRLAHRAYSVSLVAAKQDFLDDAPTEFAFTVIPNIGPGGATSEADEEDLAERDPDQEIVDADGPSVSGDKAMMAYQPSLDALYLWYPGDKAWRMWNY
jgi:hypothetical protein